MRRSRLWTSRMCSWCSRQTNLTTGQVRSGLASSYRHHLFSKTWLLPIRFIAANCLYASFFPPSHKHSHVQINLCFLLDNMTEEPSLPQPLFSQHFVLIFMTCICFSELKTLHCLLPSLSPRCVCAPAFKSPLKRRFLILYLCVCLPCFIWFVFFFLSPPFSLLYLLVFIQGSARGFWQRERGY